jgi:hypothetical protein
VVRWFGWSLFGLAVVSAAVGVAMYASADTGDWFRVIIKDPDKNWVGVVLAIMGAGWLLARATR